MALGTDVGTTIPLLPGGMNYDRQAKFDAKVSHEALSLYLWTEKLMEVGNVHKGKNDSSVFIDKELTLESSGSRRFGFTTDIVTTNFRNPARLEFRQELVYDACEVYGLADKVDSAQGRQIRSTNAMQITKKEQKFKRDLNTKLLTGDGATYTQDGYPGQAIMGLRTTLDNPTSGNYGMIARSGNTFLNNTYTDLDSGGAFASNVGTRIQTLVNACTVNIDGEQMRPTVGVTTQAGLNIMQQAYKTYLNINVNAGGVSPDKVPATGHHARASVPMSGVMFEYDDQIGESNKRLYVLTPKTWHLFCFFQNWINRTTRQIPQRLMKNDAVVFYGGGQLVCEHLAANGGGYWA